MAMLLKRYHFTWLLLLFVCLNAAALGNSFAQWLDQDIGSVDVSGTSSYNAGTGVYTVSGGGMGFSGTADSTHYLYQEIEGDCEIVVAVSSVGTDGPYSAGGLMIRDDLTPGSAFASVFVSNEDGINFSARSGSGLGASKTLGPSEPAPAWIKLQKIGSSVLGYYSIDGLTWTLVGRQSVSFQDGRFFVGMTANSVVPSTASVVTFDRLMLATNFPASIASLQMWLRADSGLTFSGTGSLVAAWEDQSGNDNNAGQLNPANSPLWQDEQINGSPALVFDGTSDYLSVVDAAALKPTTISIFVVSKRTGGNNGANFVTKADASGTWNYNRGYGIKMMGSGSSIGLFVGTATNSTTSVSTSLTSGTFSILSGRYDKQQVRFSVNGGTPVTSTATTSIVNSGTTLFIGGRSDAAHYLEGSIAEILLFARGLTDTETREVEAYLHNKYGIGVAPTLDAPILDAANPTPNSVYLTSQTISLTQIPGVTIRYTTNGDDPTESNSLIYTGPITVSTTTQFKFRAFRVGHQPSAVTSVSYVFDSLSSFSRSGLVLWLRSDQGVSTSGTSVTGWNDLSGNGNNAVQTGTSNSPTVQSNQVNSFPTLRFDGNNDYLTIADASSLKPANITAFMVAKRTGGANSSRYLVKASSGSYVDGYGIMQVGGTSAGVYANNESASRATIPFGTGTFGILSGRYDSQQVRFSINSGSAAITAYTTAITHTTSPLYLGGRTTNDAFGGDIAEVLLYNRALSETERKEVELYLYQRYALGGSPQLSPPTLPASTIFSGSQVIEIGSPLNGAEIRYSTTGTDPTISSDLYDPLHPPVMTATGTFKAVAFLGSYTPSTVVSGTYIRDDVADFSHSGLALWLRADQGLPTSNGSSVSQWSDVSGSGNNAMQGTAGNQPTVQTSQVNGNPAVRFDGSDDYLSVPDNLGLRPSNITAFVVAKATVATNQALYFAKTSTNLNDGFGVVRLASGANAGLYFNTSSTAASVVQPTGTFSILSGRYNGQQIRFSTNGGTPVTTTASGTITTTTAPLYLGSRGGSGNKFTGDIAEVILFTRALSDAERQQVESYLYQRYNLGVAPQLDPPILPAGTIFTGSQTISMIPAAEGATIRYTTTGTDPTGSSDAYDPENPPVINATTVVKAAAFRSGFATSSVTSGTYTRDDFADFTRSGLSLWLRADLGVSSTSSSVTAWKDLSGSGNDGAQATAGSQPTIQTNQINGYPVLRFDGTNDYISVPDATNLKPSNLTAFVVAKRSGGNSSGAYFAKTSGNFNDGYGMIRFAGGTSAGLYLTATANSASIPQATGTFAILNGRFTGQQAQFVINGGTAAVTGYSGTITQTTQPLTIGGRSTNNPLGGDIAEIIMFSRSLSDSEQRAVNRYLYNRYQIGSAPAVDDPELAEGSATGGLYPGSQVVTLDPPAAGVTIYYTTDGSDPTTASSVYSGPITVSSSQTLKFKAFKTGDTPSATLTLTFLIDTQTTFTRDGLSLWLRADQGVSVSGTLVTQWDDLSGNGNNAAQATSSYRPSVQTAQVNGQPVLRFDASDDHLIVPDALNLKPTAVTAFVVAKRTGGNSQGVYFAKTATSFNDGYGMMRLVSGNNAGFYINNASGTNASQPQSSGTFAILSGRYNGQQIRFAMNGGTATVTSATSAINNTTAALTIGGRGSSNPLGGDIAELLVFGRALTDSERSEVESYLYQRYAIGSAPALEVPSLPGSTIFTGTQTVTMTPPVSGATVYYTTDGSTPTTGSSVYDAGSPPALTASGTVKAIAVKSSYLTSAVASGTYTKDDSAVFARSGLSLWLRADAGVTTGTAGVTSWADQSGNNNSAIQATGTLQPTIVNGGTSANNQTVLRFDGTNDYLSIADATSLKPAKPTVYIVGKQTGGGSTGAVFFKSDSTSFANGYGMVRQTGTNNFGFYVSGGTTTAKSTGTITPNNYFLAQAAYDQNRATLVINGIPLNPGTYTTAITHSTQPLKIGGTGTATYSFGGDIAEILLFDHTLTLSEQATVEKYLGTRYTINTDGDGDGLPNWKEYELGTDPTNPDSNGNGLRDGDEYNSGYNPAGTDSDGDGLSNTAEIAAGTNPFWNDTDGDGVVDGLDAYPLDPTASSNTDPTPTTAPTINLELPTNAVLLP